MLKIVEASALKPGDRFAKRDWMESAKNRIVYRVAPPSPTAKKRRTINCVSEHDGSLSRVRKDEYVYKITK